MTDYVVLTDHLILDPVDATSGPRRHRRGQVVDLAGLDANEVKHLKDQGAVATQRSADGKAAAAEPPQPVAPEMVNPPVIEPGGAASLVGAGVQSGVDFTEALVDAAPVTDSGKPARSATPEVWRAHAVKVGAVTEAESADMSKAALQEAVARKGTG